MPIGPVLGALQQQGPVQPVGVVSCSKKHSSRWVLLSCSRRYRPSHRHNGFTVVVGMVAAIGVDQDWAAEVGAGGGPRSVLASAEGLLALRLGALAGALPGGYASFIAIGVVRRLHPL